MILVTGASGYAGGQLVPKLLQAGFRVRVLVRNRASIESRPWYGDVEVVQGDLEKGTNLHVALDGIRVAYYLVHVAANEDQMRKEITYARNFVAAATGVKHLIYTGSIRNQTGVSPYMATQAAVASTLRRHPGACEVAIGPLIGAGSGSYELYRDIVQRIPSISTGSWGESQVSVVGIDDLLTQLVKMGAGCETGRISFGSGLISVNQLLKCFMRKSGKESTAVGYAKWITPAIATEAANIVSSVPKDFIRRSIHWITNDFEKPELLAHEESESRVGYVSRIVESAFKMDQTGLLVARWSEADFDPDDYALKEVGGAFQETIALKVDTQPEKLFESVSSVGGDRGWGRWTKFWHFRGAVDKLLGGPGYRRGRRHDKRLRPGDALDFWRVRAIEENKRLLLQSEMSLPGQGFLQFEVRPTDEGAQLVQTAMFNPNGFWGWLYWWLSYPFHKLIYRDLAQSIVDYAKH